MFGNMSVRPTTTQSELPSPQYMYAFTHPSRTTLYLLYTSLCTGELNAIRKHECFLCSPFYGRACRWAMLGEIKTLRTSRQRAAGGTQPLCSACGASTPPAKSDTPPARSWAERAKMWLRFFSRKCGSSILKGGGATEESIHFLTHGLFGTV